MKNNKKNNPTDRSFLHKDFQNQTLALVEVRADWSGCSHLMDLMVNKIEEQFNGQIKVVRINFDTNQRLLGEFGVENAPAILFIKNGQVIEIIKNTLSQKDLENIVNNLIAANESVN
ncbi:MAG: thioredoxin family protein [Melioribacteraceae bacterium]|nr:thioredoxin family protein [Melioribacteraceae bacterium]